MSVYRNRQFRISRKQLLYGCCDTVTALCCNLENAVRFRQRQLLAVVRKAPETALRTKSLFLKPRLRSRVLSVQTW